MENPFADVERIKKIKDPVTRAVRIGEILNALPALTTELRAIRQAAVLELRAQGLSHAQIAEQLGLHRNRVQQIAEGRAGSRKGAGSRPTS